LQEPGTRDAGGSLKDTFIEAPTSS
jgi:hypothetical protein